MLAGGAGGLGRALADLVLARSGLVFVCDLAPEAVTRLVSAESSISAYVAIIPFPLQVEAMRVKHKEARIEGGELDVRSRDSWEAAWQVRGL